MNSLTLQEVLSDIPADPASWVVYALLLLFLGFAVIGGRNKPTPVAPVEAADMGNGAVPPTG